MGKPVVLYTKEQLPPREPLPREFVPIVSIDHLSQDFEDLPVDNILALGDQTLLRQFQRAFNEISQNRRTTEVGSQPTRDQGQMRPVRYQERNNMEQGHMPATARSQSQSQPATYRALSRPTSAQSAGMLMLDTSDDGIQLPPGWRPSIPTQQLYQVYNPQPEQHNDLLSESIDQAEVLGPLVVSLYNMLAKLESQPIYEVLLYLSGHGMDPGNLCLIPDTIKPHPARDDLRDKDPIQCYTDECQQDYLRTFYEAFRRIEAYKGPLGFVGGELYAHQRGYVGVLGVLGLWCYAHKCSPDGLFHHLVIVADCCFAGIWGATLDRIMKCTEPCLEEYRVLLLKYPVSIQCATDKFEASHGGSFTPLWYFLQTASELQLKGYERKYEEYKRSHGEPASHDFETQHPWFISTSAHAPSCKCFDNADFFVYLLGEQTTELQGDLQNSVNRMALANACSPETEMAFPDILNGLQGYSPLTHPYVTALAGAALNLRENLQVKKRQVESGDRTSLRSDSQHQRLLDRLKKSIHIIDQTLDDLRKLQHMPLPRFRHGGYVLDTGNKLNEASRRQLMKILQPHRRHTIDPGVYVFQGGEGDMSLIVTPDQEQVILIDGTKTADCFKKAWESTLRYLPRITHIFVTHHDLDHTYGIQLLLARYCVGQADMLPDISCATIYMNTRAALRRRSFGHEQEICTLANEPPLNLWVESVIVWDRPLRLLHCEDFFIEAILPKQSLVNDILHSVEGALDGDNTMAVSSRGGTTAANVLSINVVAVWKNRDAYLFTGDAHLADVTKAAQDFLRIHCMESFRYVDVPHHGSANSNVKKVDDRDLGLAGIPAEHYLISHCGNHHNPSFQTVKDILKREDREITLHFLYERRKFEPKYYFLYQERNSRPPVKNPRVPKSGKKPSKPGISCKECGVGHTTTTQNWHCICVSEAKIRVPLTCHYWECFVFFPFTD